MVQLKILQLLKLLLSIAIFFTYLKQVPNLISVATFIADEHDFQWKYFGDGYQYMEYSDKLTYPEALALCMEEESRLLTLPTKELLESIIADMKT